MAHPWWSRATAPLTWPLRQLFRLALASRSARRSTVVAAGGDGGTGEQAGTATRLFTTGTYTSATHTGVVATTAATRVTGRLAIPAIVLPATLVIGQAIQGIVHREAIPVTDVPRPPLFPRRRTRAIVPAVEVAGLLPCRRIPEAGREIIRARGPVVGELLRLSRSIQETGRAIIPARGPVAAEFLRLSRSTPETGQAKLRPRAPARTRLAAINARRHRMRLLLSRHGPTRCLVQAEGARKVHAGVKA